MVAVAKAANVVKYPHQRRLVKLKAVISVVKMRATGQVILQTAVFQVTGSAMDGQIAWIILMRCCVIGKTLVAPVFTTRQKIAKQLRRHLVLTSEEPVTHSKENILLATVMLMTMALMPVTPTLVLVVLLRKWKMSSCTMVLMASIVCATARMRSRHCLYL